jgi:hypothetical protein
MVGERAFTLSEGAQPSSAALADRSSRKIKMLAWWEVVGSPEKNVSASLSNARRLTTQHYILKGSQASPLFHSGESNT